jgi:hypothetical protein
MNDTYYTATVDGRPLRTSDNKIWRYKNLKDLIHGVVMCYGENYKEHGIKIWATNKSEQEFIDETR